MSEEALPDDYTRCYGNGCPIKNDCMRFKTIALDAHNVVRSYMLADASLNGDECEGWIG